MSELDVVAATLGGLMALQMGLDFARDLLGVTEETRTRRVLPIGKRKPARTPEAAPAGEVVPLQDRGEAA